MSSDSHTNYKKLDGDKSEWIKIIEGEFHCPECENISKPETNTVDGIVEADLDEILAELEEFPSKITYGICPVCGMEYVFKNVDGNLWLEPSDEEK